MRILVGSLVALLCVTQVRGQSAPKVMPATAELTLSGDIASQLVDGVDRFLLKKLNQSVQQRAATWPVPSAEQADFRKATSAQRQRLGKQLGLIDNEQHATAGLFIKSDVQRLQVLHQVGKTDVVAEGPNWSAQAVSWSVLPGVDGEGILLSPSGPAKFLGVVIPDAGQTPEDLCGITKRDRPVLATAAYLAAAGGRVIVPSMISRQVEARRAGSGTLLSDQEFLYRSAYELGRHIAGYQLHELNAAIQFLNVDKLPIVVVGWGEGGWLAQNLAALDPQISAVCISGHFQPRENVWAEPIHRNVFDLLSFAGDAQLAALVAPNHVVIDPVPGPVVDLPSQGGAPGKLSGPDPKLAREEFRRAVELLKPWKLDDRLHWIEPPDTVTAPVDGPSVAALEKVLSVIGIQPPAGAYAPTMVRPELAATGDQRRTATLLKWDRYNQRLLTAVESERADYWKPLQAAKREDYGQLIEGYREYFRKHIVGWWDEAPLPPQPRSRLAYDKPSWTGYEVVLDVFPDVIAYGVLLLPKGMAAGEKRPCVVFQHGLEGRPQDCIEGDNKAYRDVAAKLAERGFVVFAPQNMYIFKDRFRSLQRKSYPLGKTLFSTIVPQHQQIVRWLGGLPQVDGRRIAFYGLSYGGKSAMRIPPLVPEYCLSICSADFNDWVWKNATTYAPHSYVWTGEYEIFEFDLGPKFNYAEMAALIAPRPFMVERGHFDGVAPDDRVAMEFAKVYNLYATKLNQPNDCRIEWFVGPHTINGHGTYDFLHEKLNWPKPKD